MKDHLKGLSIRKDIYQPDIQEKELSDEELTMVIGGANSLPVASGQGSNLSSNLASGQQLNRTGYAIGG